MIYVGIDIASTKHDFIMLNDDGVFNSRRSTTIPNTVEGYKKLHETITEFCGVSNDFEVRIGLESTGFYHLNLLFFLLQKNYNVTLINPKLINLYKKSRKVHSPKNDNLDSMAICNYLYDNKSSFKPYTLISYHSESLKALSRERFSLVEDLRKAKLNIYKLVTQIFPEFLDLFTDIYSGSAIEILERYPSPKKISRAHLSTIQSLIHGRCKTSPQELIDKAKTSIGTDSEHLSFLLIQGIKKLNAVESQIDEYDELIQYYVNLINPVILSIPGISYTTAGLILGEIGDITRFKNSNSLISYAGLDIEVYESGKYKATNKSISKKGSRYLRYALYQVAKVIWRFDPSFNKYYQKKQLENKHYYVILGHIQTKVVKVIYSVLKTNQPYTPR